MEAYISQYRTSYLPWRAGEYAEREWEYCVGSKKDTEHLVQNGVIRLPWEAIPNENQLEDIKSLIIIPDKHRLSNKVIPSFVGQLPSLEHLAIPLTFVPRLKANSIPDSLLGLTIQNAAGYYEVIKGENPLWPEVLLPNLTALRFLDEFGATEINSLLGISDRYFPCLEYLECRINKAMHRLDTISELRHLRFLHLECVKNHNIFDFINSPLKALAILGSDIKFPLANIKELNGVELLWLNNIKCLVDCEMFASLPNLREINILNCRRIVNIEALLTFKGLESIQVFNCGRPFSKETEQLFYARHYKRLEIFVR